MTVGRGAPAGTFLIVRVESWEGDSLRDIEYFTAPANLVHELVDYTNGDDPQKLTQGCRDALQLTASTLPAVERNTLKEIPQHLREYLAAETIRVEGQPVPSSLTLRNQLK